MPALRTIYFSFGQGTYFFLFPAYDDYVLLLRIEFLNCAVRFLGFIATFGATQDNVLLLLGREKSQTAFWAKLHV